MTGMAARSPGSRIRRLDRRTAALVVVSAAAIVLYSVLVPLQGAVYGILLPLPFILAAGICAAPLLAITRPRIATALFCAAAFTSPLLVSAEGGASSPWPWAVPAQLSLLLLVAVVAFRHGARLAVFPLTIALLCGLAAPLLRPDVAAGDAATANLIVTAALSLAAYLVAVLAAGRLRDAQELTREREHSALEESRRMLVEERTRIARELHDVIAHSMSVIQVQASTARYRLGGLDERAVAEFDDIAATARTSLTEMRRMLGVLRTEDHDAELAPQQGIADIPPLVDSIRRAGAEVELVVEAGDATVTAPSGVQIAAFRIVQEALSNAMRHAPGAPIRVRVRAEDAELTLRIVNERPEAAPSGTGAGYGLRGMRERAEILGGTLTAGPLPDGGWSVDAVLPLASGVPLAGPPTPPTDRESS